MPDARRRRLLPVLVAGLACVAACGGGDPVTVEVQTQDWTGWQEEQPSAESASWTVAEGFSLDAPLRLSTPTMDGGTSITLTSP